MKSELVPIPERFRALIIEMTTGVGPWTGRRMTQVEVESFLFGRQDKEPSNARVSRIRSGESRLIERELLDHARSAIRGATASDPSTPLHAYPPEVLFEVKSGAMDGPDDPFRAGQRILRDHLKHSRRRLNLISLGDDGRFLRGVFTENADVDIPLRIPYTCIRSITLITFHPDRARVLADVGVVRDGDLLETEIRNSHRVLNGLRCTRSGSGEQSVALTHLTWSGLPRFFAVHAGDLILYTGVGVNEHEHFQRADTVHEYRQTPADSHQEFDKYDKLINAIVAQHAQDTYSPRRSRRRLNENGDIDDLR